jgi:hypothetical protein
MYIQDRGVCSGHTRVGRHHPSAEYRSGSFWCADLVKIMASHQRSIQLTQASQALPVLVRFSFSSVVGLVSASAVFLRFLFAAESEASFILISVRELSVWERELSNEVTGVEGEKTAG